MKNPTSYPDVMETFNRMHNRYSGRPDCKGCPMGSSNIAHCRKVAFEHPEEFAKIVMEWGEKHRLGVNEFSDEQIEQIDTVINAAKNLIRVLITKPKYLDGTTLKEWHSVYPNEFPIPPSEVANTVADMIVLRYKNDANVFFPTGIEMNDPREPHRMQCIRDVYNKHPICNE